MTRVISYGRVPLFLSRTIESLYEELVSEGIIVRPPKLSLCDYVGEYSFLGTTLRQANIEPMPSLSDVRRLVTEYTILPLGDHRAVSAAFLAINAVSVCNSFTSLTADLTILCSFKRSITSDVNKDWTCKHKDKDQAYKNQDKD